MDTDSKLKLLNVIAKSWTDPDFKQQLLNNPTAVLAREGVAVREGAHVTVIEQNPNEVFLILPPMPGGELTIENVTSRIVASVELTRDSAALTIF